MRNIKIQCPAKINLNLKIVNKREDGFHNINSEMQTISLFDYLNISVEESIYTEIFLSGNSPEIPYDKSNLVYKATELFLSKIQKTAKISCFIEKNIPIAAGLAGGSTDATGILYGLNKLFNEPLSMNELHILCAKLGSDLNVCLTGGRLLCEGRGEKISSLPFVDTKVSLIKPLNLGISARDAYSAFSYKIQNNTDIITRACYINDLEWAIIDKYKELQYIKNK